MMAYRFCGMPTSDHAHMLSQIASSSRFLWNRILADIQARYEAGEKFFIPASASYKKVPSLEWLKGMDPQLCLTYSCASMQRLSDSSKIHQGKAHTPVIPNSR